jgi:ketosteroid isomerase-like protein
VKVTADFLLTFPTFWNKINSLKSKKYFPVKPFSRSIRILWLYLLHKIEEDIVMRKSVILIALMLLLCAVGFGQKKMTVAQTLTKIEREIAAGIVKGDTSVFTKYFAATAAFTDPDGALMTRTESIAMFKSGDLKFESLTVEDVKVKLYGDTAIVTYRSKDKGSYKDQPIVGESRWTDTWARINGKWLIVATQGTTIAPMPQ